MGSETPVKNLGDMFFQHEIKEFSVSTTIPNVLHPASPCFTEAFCLVLLPAMTTKFPVRFVRRMAEWGAGRTAAWSEGRSSCCQLLYVVW